MTRNLRAQRVFDDLGHTIGRLSRLADVAFLGDFGKGVSTGSGLYSDPGGSVYQLFGPVAPGATSVMPFAAGYGSNAIPQVPMRLGMPIDGSEGTEWILCRYVASSSPDLKPGMLWFIDENYTATLATGSNKVLGAQTGVSYVFQTAPANGTYYLWLAVAGRLLIKDAGSSVATGSCDSTATAGSAKFTATHTTGQGTSSPFTAWGASSNITFKANTVSGSPYLTNVQSQISINGVVGGITDLIPGMTITGTGMPSNALIASIDQQGGLWRVTLGTDTSGNLFTPQNATANGTAVTFTVTSHVQALMYWPTVTNVA